MKTEQRKQAELQLNYAKAAFKYAAEHYALTGEGLAEAQRLERKVKQLERKVLTTE